MNLLVDGLYACRIVNMGDGRHIRPGMIKTLV
jgi:hypothetical protein